MLNEATVRREIRQALDPVVTPAPWLTANIRNTLRGRAVPQDPKWWRLGAGARSRAAALAAILLLIALVAGLVFGSRLLNPHRDIPVVPQVPKYGAAISTDFGDLEHLVATTTPCDSAHVDSCRKYAADIKTSIQKFQNDVEKATMPPGVANHRAVLTAALADMMSTVDAMLADLDRKDFGAYARGAAHLFDVKLNVVYPFSVAVSCWPKAAIGSDDSQGYMRFRCGSTTSEEYVRSLSAGWDVLRAAINATKAACQSHTSTCRKQTVALQAAVADFKTDLTRKPVPVEYTTFELELEDGLNTLLAGLDDRLAAIDSRNQKRWDAANITIEQAKFNVIARAIGEIACWPKGVQKGDDSSAAAWPCAST